MSICRPAGIDVAILHHNESMSIRQSQVLIVKLDQSVPDFREFSRIERLDFERRQNKDKCEKLRCTAPVIPPKKPAMTLRNNERRRYQSRRGGKEAFEDIVIAV